MKVVGIDPGTASCGYGVVDERGRHVTSLAHGCWRTASATALQLRLKQIFDAVTELIEEYRPDAVALEESFVGVDARTALSVGQVRGAVLVSCARAGVPSAEYSPNRVKHMLCGYGHADKAQMQHVVQTLLGLSRPPTPHHAADALAVAICHALAPPLLGHAASPRTRAGTAPVRFSPGRSEAAG
ncbi:MAG: crossover junction endodeoxyribonuclease RuvC [Actinomycetota bacterium]|nr:crossover junction endodeoxyribonuclease RuvC [Actinomycetota bacterium]